MPPLVRIDRIQITCNQIKSLNDRENVSNNY